MTTSPVVRTVSLGSPAALTQRTRLSLADGISFGEWVEIGEELLTLFNRSSWWVADWAAYGDRRFHQTHWPALQAMRPGGYAWQTLKNIASISGRVEPSRRRDGLSFSHHGEVASLPPDLQDEFLDAAETQGWSVMELRDEVSRRKGRDKEPLLSFSVRATGEIVSRFESRALALGVEAKDLVMEVLELASQLDDPLAVLEAAGAHRAIEAVV